MSRRRRPTMAVGILTSMLLLTACGGPPVTEEQEAATGVTTVATTGASIRPGPCVPGDLADSEFGPHLGSAVIRVDSGEYFHFGVAENHYDSCRELSWIILDGQIGDRAGTSIRPAGTVIFFHGTQLADEYRPRLYLGVESVRPRGDNSALITWRHEQEPHHSEETVALTGTRLTDVEHSTPEEWRGRVPVVDLHSPPIESGSGVPPHGNVHGGPFDAVLPTGRYRVPLTGDQDLLCDITEVVDCYRDLGARGDDPSLPRVTVTLDGPVAGRGQAPDGPWTTLPRNGYFRVGAAIVDLTGTDEVRFSRHEGSGVFISPDAVGRFGNA